MTVPCAVRQNSDVSQTRSGCTNKQQTPFTSWYGSVNTHSAVPAADIMTSGWGESEWLNPPQYKFAYHKAYVG